MSAPDGAVVLLLRDHRPSLMWVANQRFYRQMLLAAKVSRKERGIMWGKGRGIMWGKGRGIMWGKEMGIMWGKGRGVMWGKGRRGGCVNATAIPPAVLLHLSQTGFVPLPQVRRCAELSLKAVDDGM